MTAASAKSKLVKHKRLLTHVARVSQHPGPSVMWPFLSPGLQGFIAAPCRTSAPALSLYPIHGRTRPLEACKEGESVAAAGQPRLQRCANRTDKTDAIVAFCNQWTESSTTVYTAKHGMYVVTPLSADIAGILIRLGHGVTVWRD
jgi:hypothetical protein